MFDLSWFLRMSQWARHPPSWKRVKLVLAVVVICFAIVAADRLGLWPASWTLDRSPGGTLR